MLKKIFLVLTFIFIMSGCTNNNKQEIKKKEIPQSFSIETHDDLVSEYNKAIIKTNLGDIEVEFFNNLSPKTVNNFLNLAYRNFYDNTKFHRVIKDFIIQAGDPNSRNEDWTTHGTGGPGYKFADEFNDQKLIQGSLAMANAGPNTNGSQFFIVTAPSTPWLDGKHTNFGKVINGMDIVKKIEGMKTNSMDHPLEDVIIKDMELIKK